MSNLEWFCRPKVHQVWNRGILGAPSPVDPSLSKRVFKAWSRVLFDTSTKQTAHRSESLLNTQARASIMKTLVDGTPMARLRPNPNHVKIPVFVTSRIFSHSIDDISTKSREYLVVIATKRRSA
uniref:Uncharacterized protein n=1 Tax=Utricularia reniformis TaxID=192314 RepID=A0A1Y0B306_9LAMI|nr:hypothetical protein AEK19_MT1628 [Utricularia reniformis]ART31812.1 hypothetical protein AEK19_MT1628 [Utricularia reniformis]